jgi:predicted transcriptional regulator
MGEEHTVSVRLSASAFSRLAEIAEHEERSVETLAADALDTFLRFERAEMELIAERLRRADAGAPSTPHDVVDRWLCDLAGGDDLPPPGHRSDR